MTKTKAQNCILVNFGILVCNNSCYKNYFLRLFFKITIIMFRHNKIYMKLIIIFSINCDCLKLKLKFPSALTITPKTDSAYNKDEQTDCVYTCKIKQRCFAFDNRTLPAYEMKFGIPFG